MSNTRTISMTLLLAVAFLASLGPEHDGEPAVIPAGETTIAVWNETDNAQAVEIVEWAVERYAAAGLEVPSTEVVFHQFEPGLIECNGFGGYYRVRRAEYQIDMCAVGVPSRRHILLHEFAHAWAHVQLTEEHRRTFQAERSLKSWNDDTDARDERATEHVAEIIAWGLDLRCNPQELIVGEDAAELASAFESLTGVLPICGP